MDTYSIILNILSIIVTIVAMVVTIYTYKKSKPAQTSPTGNTSPSGFFMKIIRRKNNGKSTEITIQNYKESQKSGKSNKPHKPNK